METAPTEPTQETKELSPAEIEKQKVEQEEKEKAEAEKKFKEFLQEKYKEWDFREEDERRYSFVFNGDRFIFRIPNIEDKVKIKLLLSRVTTIPKTGLRFSTDEIMDSKDLDLIVTAKVLTHTAVLLDEAPKDFNIENLNDVEQFNLGYQIQWCEVEFMDRKKKVS